jgi:uncharacterized protein YqjF (DUF2071 family)
MARRLVSIREGGVIKTGEGRAISYKNKSVYIPNKQRTGVLSNGLKAYEVMKVKKGRRAISYENKLAYILR